MEVPGWLLQEIGRLYVHGLALERALAEQAPASDDEPDAP